MSLPTTFRGWTGRAGRLPAPFGSNSLAETPRFLVGFIQASCWFPSSMQRHGSLSSVPLNPSRGVDGVSAVLLMKEGFVVEGRIQIHEIDALVLQMPPQDVELVAVMKRAHPPSLSGLRP